MPPKNVTISAARQAFFDLFASVTEHRGRKVVITSRGSANQAVLVEESYLNELESAAKQLRDIKSGKSGPRPEFKLVGSGRLAEGSDDALADIRAEANALWTGKLTSFAKAKS